MKSGAPSLQSSHLIDQVRERIRCQDYIQNKNYFRNYLFFCRHTATQTSDKRYELEMGGDVCRGVLAVATKGAQVVGRQHPSPLTTLSSAYPSLKPEPRSPAPASAPSLALRCIPRSGRCWQPAPHQRRLVGCRQPGDLGCPRRPMR